MSQLPNKQSPGRIKIVSAVGILTMLFGALLVFAPGAGADDGDGGVTLSAVHDATHNADLNSNQRGTTFADMLANNPNETCPTPTGDQGGFAWHFVTQANADFTELNVDFATAGVSLDVDEVSDPDESHAYVYTDTADTLLDATAIVNPDPGEERTKFQLSHVCEFEVEDEPKLTVEKVVVGTPPAEASYAIDVTADDVLVEDDEPISPILDYTRDGAATYDLTESVTSGATSVSWACFRPEAGTAFLTSATATIEDIDVTQMDARCVVTNTYTSTPPPLIPPPPVIEVDDARLTVVKAVSGDSPDEWSFPFDGGALSTFDLTNADADISFEELTAGEYTVTETDSGLASLDSIVCDNADATVDLEAGSVTVDLDEGDDVTCTFTNGYEIEVLPEEVTPEPPAPVVTPVETEVLGETVTRTLPRTGSGTGHLATAGIALMLFGAVLVGGSRRLQTMS